MKAKNVKYKGKKYKVDKKTGVLDLSNKNIENINEIIGLEELFDLRELNLNNNQIKEIEALESLTNLQILNLSENNITQIKGLDNLKTLMGLYLLKNQINEIKGLDSLIDLEFLDLGENNINEIKGLEKLSKLETLRLSKNQISEIKGVEFLSNLLNLLIEFNQISEIKNLDKLNNLQRLALNSNQIKEIEGLESLTNLKFLSLEFNQINEFKNLEKLINLELLGLHHNNISEINDLSSFGKLFALTLDENPIYEDLTKKYFAMSPKFTVQFLKDPEWAERRYCEQKENLFVPVDLSDLFVVIPNEDRVLYSTMCRVIQKRNIYGAEAVRRNVKKETKSWNSHLLISDSGFTFYSSYEVPVFIYWNSIKKKGAFSMNGFKLKFKTAIRKELAPIPKDKFNKTEIQILQEINYETDESFNKRSRNFGNFCLILWYKYQAKLGDLKAIKFLEKKNIPI